MFECVNVQRQNVCRQFHLEKAWISTGPVTAEIEERCGSALCVEDDVSIYWVYIYTGNVIISGYFIFRCLLFGLTA
jgi:hypothetical protein